MATRPLGNLATKAVVQVIEMSGQFFAHALVEMAAMVASANDETKGTKEKLETVLTVLREMEVKVKVTAMREELDIQNQEPVVLEEEAQFPHEEPDVAQEEPKDAQQGADQGSKKKKKKRRAKKKKNVNTTNELSGQLVRTSHDFEGDLTMANHKQIEQQIKETGNVQRLGKLQSAKSPSRRISRRYPDRLKLEKT